MASLRLMSFPSTTDFQTPLAQKSHARSFSRTIRNPFVLSFSATAQEQAVADIPRKSSSTRLVIQSIPWDANADDVRALAEPYGAVLDVEVIMSSPTKNRGIAYVSFTTQQEAQAALTNIKEIDGRPVVPEYAYHRVRKSTKLPVTFNLFVGNLPNEANSKDLKEFFKAEYDSVYSAEVKMKPDPAKPICYGFVAFESKKQAETALTALQGKMFMERPLRLERCEKYVKEAKQVSS